MQAHINRAAKIGGNVMSGSSEHRRKRLCAVLIADIVGYTKLVESDTDRTVTAWKAARSDIIEPALNNQHGRIVKFTGDGFLAEFPTVHDAVTCAMAMQARLTESFLTFRMGVNLGDVVDDGDDIHGEGVNIAARIEALADPGCIAVSGSVHEQVRNRIAADYTDMGERRLKHVNAPVHVFQIANFAQGELNAPAKAASPVDKASLMNPVNAKKLPRVLVAPFRNISNNKDSEDIVEGIVEDLTTELSQVRTLEVISNGASGTLDSAGDRANLNEIHGIDFTLTGSIRSAGNRIRVSVELLDSLKNNVLWSERFDEIFDDIFDIQDRIVRKTIFIVTGEIEVQTLDRAHRKPSENMTSYELMVKGKRLHHQYKRETHPKALEFFNKAIEADPENGSAYAWRACTIGGLLNRGYLPPSEEISMDSVLASIEKARELNSDDFECYRMLCRTALVLEKDHEKSLQYGAKAYDLNPNDPRILWAYGTAMALSGNGAGASDLLAKAAELSPNFGVEGTRDLLWSALLVSAFVENKFLECAEWFAKIDNVDFRSFLLNAYGSQQCEASRNHQPSNDELIAKFRTLDHDNEIEAFLFKDPSVTDRLKAFCVDLFSS